MGTSVSPWRETDIRAREAATGRGLHSPTVQLNLSRF